ncbi:phage capsid protein [Akkermansia glycaniphila]|uniref:Uncharacterized protein n=1 Tax=Akkermansia glycaniphila TaxID=1679444 RepID=A0A1C7P9N5_9BACT|nr:phage capsid protein [Akkermansia glycaniphila]OCA02195.1 hypothetical protein AC781_11590 [Akkermansia glycaniphila]SEH99320.1 Hypothetical protein PYTT_2379 [Akkermansia glycaniphila]
MGNNDIPAFFRPEFENNFRHATQQQVSRLNDYLTVRTGASGNKYVWDILDASEAHLETNNRLGRTIVDEVTGTRRTVTPEIVRKTSVLDKNDSIFLGTQSIATSDLLHVHKMAFARKEDGLIIGGAFGVNYGGMEGNTPLTLLESQKIPVNYTDSGTPVDCGITMDKLLTVREILESNEVLYDDEENSDPLILLISPAVKKQLLGLDKLTSADYAEVKALVEGRVKKALGIRFVTTNKLPKDANGNTRCLAYVRSGLNFFPWAADDIRVDSLPERNYAIQVYTEKMYGVCRSDELKFVEVVCKTK